MAHPLTLFALGGLGEIGMNCTVFELDGRRMLIDCGVLFPDDLPGVDIVHPSFDPLLEGPEVSALVLTHGHEDHIGAVPYLWERLRVPVFGPRYALGLVEQRCQELGLDTPPPMHAIEPGDGFDVGPFQVEPYRVTHSIPDSLGFIVRSEAGVVVHSGDFKIDPEPVDGQHFDSERLRRLADEGVALLLSDSTNVDSEGPSVSERFVAGAVARRARDARQLLVICLFPSNVYRMRAALDVARATDRKVLLLGRSALRHYELAQDLRILPRRLPEVIAPERASQLPRHKLLVIATGSQGEPAAALPRLAAGVHPLLALRAGDEVIMSSRVIPGHELPVHRMLDQLERGGVKVWHRNVDPDLHASGHACRQDQRALLEWLRPRAFVPIHGTLQHLRRHAELARELGVEQTVVIEDGALLRLDDGVLHHGPHRRLERVCRQGGRVVDERTLGQRRALSEAGAILVILYLDQAGGVAAGPHVQGLGVAGDDALWAELNDRIRQATSRLVRPVDPRRAERQLERAAGRLLRQQLAVRPLVHVTVMTP